MEYKKIKNLSINLDHNICSSWSFKISIRINGEVIKQCDPHIGYYIEEQKNY